MAKAMVRNVELDHSRSGTSDPDVVWGHGLSSNQRSEDGFGLLDFGRLAGVCRLLRYDARGHGASGFTTEPTAYSWAELGRDQLALTKQLGIGRYVAAGASMGCGTALHAAVLAPDRIGALVLVIPPTAWETRAERVEVWEQVAQLIEAKGAEGFIAGVAAMPKPDPLAGRPEWDDNMAANARRTDPVRLAGLFRGAGHADLPPREAVATIGVPTLILAWTGDPGHPQSTAEQLAELLPQAQLHLASTWDQFQSWTDHTVDFLASLPAI